MEINNLSDFVKGWFIGNFNPTLFETDQFEVAIKRYTAGDYECEHWHNVATEFTVIISGNVEMAGMKFHENDIIIIKPGEKTDFKCITDVITLVVKIPCVKNDKST